MGGRHRGGWTEEGSDLARAFSGAFLFGIPLLYTMELWRVSSYVPLWKLLLFLVVAFAANMALSYFIGFRPRRPSAADAVAQAIESVAVGVVGSVALLAAIGRIGAGQPLVSMLSTVVVETVPLSIGASVAGAMSAGEGRTGAGSKRG